jgi:hypothetical protein
MLEGGVAQDRIATLTDKRGTDFIWSSTIQNRLREAGAGTKLIERIAQISR